jgi:hypothetical protein
MRSAVSLSLFWLALGWSGCFLDTAPLSQEQQSMPPTSERTQPSTMNDWKPSAPSDFGVIMTREVCSDDDSGCAVRCTSSSDCPASDPCQSIECVDNVCRVAALSCEDDAGVCQAPDASAELCGACVPGSSECSSERARRGCDDRGRWSEAELCSVMCTAGACSECQPSAVECRDNNLRTCSKEGRWSEQACQLGCSDKLCHECAPASVSCSDDNQAARVCSASGRWEAPAACEHGCAEGRCKSCRQDATRCSADKQERCDAAGTWQPAAACSAGCAGDRCATCRAGTRECVGTNAQRECAESGEWGANVECSLGCTAGRCNECTAGAERCDGPGIQRCSAELRWETVTECPNGCDGSQCAECRNGTIECTSRFEIRHCRDRKWSSSSACRPNAHCDASAPGGNTCPCDDGYIDPHPEPGLCEPR